jgi:hypothetical protein
MEKWLVGETVTDRHGLIVPAALADGTYSLRLEAYQPRQQKSLSYQKGSNSSGGAQSLELTKINVQRHTVYNLVASR